MVGRIDNRRQVAEAAVLDFQVLIGAESHQHLDGISAVGGVGLDPEVSGNTAGVLLRQGAWGGRLVDVGDIRTARGDKVAGVAIGALVEFGGDALGVEAGKQP